MGRRHADWVEARAIVHASGSIIPPLIISYNNLGSVTIEKNMDEIVHRLLVRKATKKIKVHESIVTTANGKSPLEDNIRAKVSKYVQE